MFWIKLFWFEAVAVPCYFLWALLQAPVGSPFRRLNLAIWSLTLLASLASYAWTKRPQKSKPMEEHP